MHVSSFRVKLNLKMALLQYLKRNDIPKVPLPSKLNSLSQCQLQQVNDHIRKTVGDEATSSGIGKKRRHGYNQYSDEERAEIGKYAAENGATKACRHFTATAYGSWGFSFSWAQTNTSLIKGVQKSFDTWCQ